MRRRQSQPKPLKDVDIHKPINVDSARTWVWNATNTFAKRRESGNYNQETMLMITAINFRVWPRRGIVSAKPSVSWTPASLPTLRSISSQSMMTKSSMPVRPAGTDSVSLAQQGSQPACDVMAPDFFDWKKAIFMWFRS